MIRLLDLPKEILFKIFDPLDFESIQTLYSIPQFEQSLQGFATVVSDLDEAAATSWISPSCPYVNFKELGVDEVKSHHVFYVLENCLDSELVQKIILNQDRPNTVILSNKLMKSVNNGSLDQRKIHLYDYALFLNSSKGPADPEKAAEYFESDAYHRYKEVSYENIKKLIALSTSSKFLESVECPYVECVELRFLEFDAMKFRTPNVKEMVLFRCINTNSSAKLSFPVLAEVTFDMFCKSFIDCMDLENCPAESLTVEEGDIVKWENLVIGKAKRISISIMDATGPPHGSLRNVSIPRCEDLTLRGFTNVFNVTAPLVSKLNIESNIFIGEENDFSMRNFQADKVKALSITGFGIAAEFPTVLFESVVNLELHNIKFLCSGTFQNVEELKISGKLEGCFQMIDTKKLTSLKVYRRFVEAEGYDTDDFDLSGFSFPKLEKVEVTEENEFDFLKTLNAPNLEELSINRPRSISFLNIFSNGFENLQKLKVSEPSFPIMEDIKLQNLQVLEIALYDFRPLNSFKIVNCYFPNLHSFFLKPRFPRISGGDNWIAPSGTIDIEAPKLDTFCSTFLKIDHLDLTRFPKLIELTVNYIKKITLGDVAQNLSAFEIQGNSLREMSYTKDPENIHRFVKSFTPKRLKKAYKLFQNHSKANQLLVVNAIIKKRRQEL